MNFIGSKTIETERLILKSSKMAEQKKLYEILMNPEVNKWYLTSGKKHANDSNYWTWEIQEKFYKSKVDKANNSDVFGWSIFLKSEYSNSNTEEIIGQVTAQENGSDLTIRDVGWYIDPKYQGMGYATEAAKAMIKYMFELVEIEKIISGAVKDNIGSCKIFEKLGFIKTGEITHESKYTFYDGTLTSSKYEMDKKLYLKKWK
ncbi:MAG: GNAT family N-acetyltransferase [Bacilli bacterium]|nr:GNAT family N-acetyltransferase [Bacilli bacterium]